MKKQYFKTIGSTLIISAFLFLAFGSGNDKPKEIKTSFQNCDELLEYVRYTSYSSLKSDWGEGNIGEPRDASSVGDLDMEVNVKWNNVKCNGKPVEITFKNRFTGLSDAFSKDPGNFQSVYCGDYE